MTGAGMLVYALWCCMTCITFNRESCIDQEDEIPVPDAVSSCFTTKNINITCEKSFNGKLYK